MFKISRGSNQLNLTLSNCVTARGRVEDTVRWLLDSVSDHCSSDSIENKDLKVGVVFSGSSINLMFLLEVCSAIWYG